LLSGMANPQMFPAPVQLVKLQLHSPAPLPLHGLVCTKRDRVLRGGWGKWVWNCLGIKLIGPQLVLRGAEEECSP
jgi:hypothetical protein